MVFTSPVWDLQAIITEFRGITGRPDTSMLTDQQCADFINYYYQFVLPKELKIFWGYTYYQFYTQANVDQYEAPQDFQTFNPEAWVDGFPLEWNINPDTFYLDYPQQLNKQNVATADGINNGPYSFTLSAYPVLQRSVYVTDGVQIAQDVPTNSTTGTFIDPDTGSTLVGASITYATGAVTGLVFTSTPATNATIVASYQTFFAARPQEILFYKTAPLADSTQATLDDDPMFVLRPVPDQVYLIKLQTIQVPKPLINLTDVPFRPDLGPLIALGAAIHLFKRFNQMDQIDLIMPEYLRYKDVSMQDTYEEYLYERSVPKF